ncbi:MAG: hypothetical protein GXP19_01005 [Gammaproteobacteria bacterium]|nr:hypothetical protein [Gammaproteobacteria bacterium]
MKRQAIILITASSILLAQPVFALEVDREVMPRITIGGRVIGTVDAVDFDSDPNAKSEINIDDSVLLTRFDKRLYGGGVAGAVLGMREDDNAVLFHEANVFYWSQNIQAAIGQTRLRNSLIEFPTLRDEDLLSYSHVGNASSNDELHQLYGKQISFDWILDQKDQSLGAWFGSRDDEASLEQDGLDSHGVGYTYEISEDLLFVKRLRHAGILVDRQKVNLMRNEWMTALVAGAEFNLNLNPQANWSMALQAIVNNGVDGLTLANLTSPSAVAMQARAKSTALIASIRYTSRPHLLTRWQAALNVAYKDYSDFSNATQLTLIPSFVYTLGQGVDLLGQISYTDFDNSLGDGTDTQIQLGIAFNFDTRFNDNIGERNSILNIEHGYIN